ncbi:MAG TPA: hypothetical protein VIC62_09100, partial [Nakamurella sp.]
GDALVSLPGHKPDISLLVTLDVQAGISALTATVEGTLVADGSPQPVTVTATPADKSVTDFGSVTFDTGSNQVSLACGGKPDRTATCTFDGTSLKLELTITRTAEPSSLAIATVDEKQRKIENNFADLTVLAPASLQLSPLTVTSPLVAGGTGEITVTVSNSGGVSAVTGPVTLVGPDGISISGITPTSCSTGCTVPAQGSTDVTVALSVAPQVTTPAALQLRIGDLITDPMKTAVGAGIDSVEISPADDLVADGKEVTRTVTVVSKLGDPGPVTLSAPDGVTLTGCGTKGARVTCAAPFDLGISVPAGTSAGPLGLTAFDSGGRGLHVTALTVATPASLTLDVPTSTSVIAGGSGTLTVTVRNTGGSPSAGGESITAALPKGLTLTGTSIPGSSCTGPARAALALAVPTAAAAADCTLPSMKPGVAVPVTFSFDALPSAPNGQVIGVSLADHDPELVPLTVKAGITGLAADPKVTLPANGTPQSVTLTATPAAEGLDLGSVAITSGDDAVQVACADSCRVSADNTVTLTITVSAKRAAGPLTLLAEDGGERPIPVSPITVLGAPQLTVSELTMNVQPVQGGEGRFSLAVSNSGDSPSTGGEPVTAAAPGLSVDSLDTGGGGSICTSGCTLPPVAVKSSVTVVVTVTAPATTKPDSYSVTMEVLGQKKTIAFKIDQAVTGVVATPGGPFAAGTSPELNLTVDRLGDSAVPLTLTSTSDLVTLSGCGSSGRSLRCEDRSFPLTVSIGAALPAGRLPITVTDAAGVTVPLTDANKKPLMVTASPARLTLSELTIGQYNPAGGTRLDLTVSNLTANRIGDRSAAFDLSPGVLGQFVVIR